MTRLFSDNLCKQLGRRNADKTKHNAILLAAKARPSLWLVYLLITFANNWVEEMPTKQTQCKAVSSEGSTEPDVYLCRLVKAFFARKHKVGEDFERQDHFFFIYNLTV